MDFAKFVKERNKAVEQRRNAREIQGGGIKYDKVCKVKVNYDRKLDKTQIRNNSTSKV